MMNQHTSVDPDEVAIYERLSSTWWDSEGPLWPLHRMNALRVDYIVDRINREFGRTSSDTLPLHGLRILDIGCGGGILSEAVARLGGTVHGVDVVAKNIGVARLHAEGQGLQIRYETASAEILAGRGEQYDVVLNMEVVEHVAELALFLDACMRVVRPGGLMFIATINRTLASWIGAIVMAEYVLRWLPRGIHRWSRFPTPLELENHLNSGRMKVVDRSGVAVNPLNWHFRLSRYMGINYIITARKDAAS
ncbi:MAG: ubiquinone biosynthesis O-methyltransferase [Proteobacteria bacterium]|nr:ubiquinone biosynthesis O-methyltransferase [Pseudomonadota bacterium]